MPIKSFRYSFVLSIKRIKSVDFQRENNILKRIIFLDASVTISYLIQKNVSFWTFNVINGNNHVVVSNRKHSTKFWPTQVGPGELPYVENRCSVVDSSIEKKVRTKINGNKFCMAVRNASCRRKIFGYEFDGSVQRIPNFCSCWKSSGDDDNFFGVFLFEDCAPSPGSIPDKFCRLFGVAHRWPVECDNALRISGSTNENGCCFVQLKNVC